MKDEIKEILDKILLNCDTQEEKNKLYNYITNLQEENELLETIKNYHINIIDGMEETLEDYKLRIDKAIINLENSIKSINTKLENNKEPFEVINGRIQYLNDYQVCRLKAIRMKCKELSNILQGEDKDE